MIRFASFAALMLVAAPAFAADATAAVAAPSAPVHRGQVLRDVSGARLGVIDSVSNDGSVGLIVDAKYVRLPATLVSNVDGKAMTTLTKKAVAAIH